MRRSPRATRDAARQRFGAGTVSAGSGDFAILSVLAAITVLLAILAGSSRAYAAGHCVAGGGAQAVGPPRATLAWRAAPVRRTSFYRGTPGAGGSRIGTIDPSRVEWLLVLAAREHDGRCWLKLRLPDRPNRAAGWVAADRLLIQPTPWRLTVSLRARTLTVLHAGDPRQVLSVVVGARATPTPRGLFSIVHAWRGDPYTFVGSWVLGLTAHSDVLRHFEGGSGEVGIHGRGGTSLLDPLGSAASHGCVRLANRAIDRLVATIGRANLPGIPVVVRA